MTTRATARVERLVRAYELLHSEEHHPLFERRLSARRTDALRMRITAVLPLLTPAETARYYAAVARVRVGGSR